MNEIEVEGNDKIIFTISNDYEKHYIFRDNKIYFIEIENQKQKTVQQLCSQVENVEFSENEGFLSTVITINGKDYKNTFSIKNI